MFICAFVCSALHQKPSPTQHKSQSNDVLAVVTSVYTYVGFSNAQTLTGSGWQRYWSRLDQTATVSIQPFNQVSNCKAATNVVAGGQCTSLPLFKLVAFRIQEVVSRMHGVFLTCQKVLELCKSVLCISLLSTCMCRIQTSMFLAL